jgi:glycosyltransferase involved in cell wall biosynthesis
MNPKVSVVTISHDRAGYLPEAIASVLAQSFADWEMVVIDDGSTDDTEGMVARYAARDARMRYFRNETCCGIVRSRNRGLAVACGEYVAVLDSDDAWCDPDKLKMQAGFLDGQPDYAIVGGGVIVVDAHGRETKRFQNPNTDPRIRAAMLFKNPLAHSSVMFRKEAALAVGGYGAEPSVARLDANEDYALFLEIGRHAKMANSAEPMLKYRTHEGNMSIAKRREQMRNSLLLILKHRDDYPNIHLAVARRLSRLCLYELGGRLLKK